jgi:dolichyl-phosphate beta-glucosyltransferase
VKEILSVVIPSFRGASILSKQLPVFIQYLKKSEFDFEIIVVDDGSDDSGETAEVVRNLGCRLILQPVNLGKGAAVRRGILECAGTYIIYTDVDIPFEFNSFDRFVQTLRDGGQVVVGDRTLPDSTYFSQISFVRKTGSDLFSFIVSRLFTDGLHDTQCGMKGFTRNAAFRIFPYSRINGFAFDVEVIMLAIRNDFRISRLPVRLRCNDSKTVKVLKHGTIMLFDLLRILFFQKTGLYDRTP